MTTDALIEIQYLKQLIETLPASGSGSAMNVVMGAYGKIASIDDEYEAFLSFYKVLGSLPSIVEEKFPEKGRRAAALHIVEKMKDAFSPFKLSMGYSDFRGSYINSIRGIIFLMPILEDICFDASALVSNTDNIISEIDNIRKKVGISSDISDATRFFVDGQLILLERALLKFQSGGVGPFRDCVFTSIGKVYIELQSADSKSSSVKEIMDGVLRIYGLMQVGGDILKLSGPVISGLLAAPSAG